MIASLSDDLRAFGAAARKEWRLLRRYPTLFLGFLFWPIILPLSYVLQGQAYAGGSAAAFVDATNFLFAIVSGVAFPITVLPIFVRPVAYLLPTTYALDLLRAQALGTRTLMEPALEWIALVAFGIATVWFGRWIFLRTEHRLRVRGTLGQH